jgi:Zn-finger nucleic acid-binding protein
VTGERESKQTNESTLLCPRCVSQMLPVQRFGVTIDQCTGCGGVFLDRGELEQLSEAEAKFYAAAQQPPQPPPAGYPPQQYAAQPGYVEKTRPRGFLGGLFGEGYYGGRHGGYRGGHH